jgi:hypothetical protein
VPPPDDAKQPDGAAPEPIGGADDSTPVASGAIAAGEHADSNAPARPVEPIRDSPTGRARRITGMVQDAVSGGVEKLGAGIGTLGEGVTKLGELTDKVPLLGAGVTRLGEGIAKAGESIHELPKVAQTRRGRLLVRSVIVGFLLVAVWIAVIVSWQLHQNNTPDFRPDAERILVALSNGSAALVYEESSPRFQENVREERFVDDMTDMTTTLGRFREITAINKTLVTTGPTGEIGRVSMTAAFDKGVCPTAISFHYHDGDWKFLGINLDLPPDLKITQAQREQRVAACKDPMDPKTCELHRLADSILARLRDGKAAEVWDGGDDLFKKQETRDKFIQIQDDHARHLGAYKRILDVTEAKRSKSTARIGGQLQLVDSATFEVLAEFEKSSGVRTVFGFERNSETKPWLLHSFKIVVPMPRPEDAGPATPGSHPPASAPGDAGVHDAIKR